MTPMPIHSPAKFSIKSYPFPILKLVAYQSHPDASTVPRPFPLSSSSSSSPSIAYSMVDWIVYRINGEIGSPFLFGSHSFAARWLMVIFADRVWLIWNPSWSVRILSLPAFSKLFISLMSSARILRMYCQTQVVIIIKNPGCWPRHLPLRSLACPFFQSLTLSLSRALQLPGSTLA